MICSLLAYDTNGNVIATLDHMVARDDNGDVIGLIDFAAHEEAGGEHTDIWKLSHSDQAVKGSKVWPEWLGIRAHEFRVELDGPPGRKKIVALVHRKSGHRRERKAIEAAIEAAPIVEGVRDIRHIVGGPGRPLALVEDHPAGTPAHLPLIGASNG